MSVRTSSGGRVCITDSLCSASSSLTKKSARTLWYRMKKGNRVPGSVMQRVETLGNAKKVDFCDPGDLVPILDAAKRSMDSEKRDRLLHELGAKPLQRVCTKSYVCPQGAIRLTQDSPSRASLYDFLQVLCGWCDEEVEEWLSSRNVLGGCGDYVFEGSEYGSPVIGGNHAVDIMNNMPGEQAGTFRRDFGAQFVERLGGSTTHIRRDDELSRLFDCEGATIRLTGETPNRAALPDLIQAVCKMSRSQAYTWLWRSRSSEDGGFEFLANCDTFQFAGPGRPTPVVDARTAVQVMNHLPGTRAAEFRARTADVFVRYLGGDPALLDEVVRNNQIQQAAEPNDPVRFFGQDTPNLVEIQKEMAEHSHRFHLELIDRLVDKSNRHHLQLMDKSNKHQMEMMERSHKQQLELMKRCTASFQVPVSVQERGWFTLHNILEAVDNKRLTYEILESRFKSSRCTKRVVKEGLVNTYDPYQYEEMYHFGRTY